MDANELLTKVLETADEWVWIQGQLRGPGNGRCAVGRLLDFRDDNQAYNTAYNEALTRLNNVALAQYPGIGARLSNPENPLLNGNNCHDQ